MNARSWPQKLAFNYAEAEVRPACVAARSKAQSSPAD